ncbi:MAG TPA: hypothetical protein VFF79_06260 [Conexibacter sp.]|jgi:hypothetical protein|nr:hypothetical protein [Conexibacter sp.]
MSAATRTPLAETPDRDGAFPRLSERQIAALAAHGTRRAVRLVHEHVNDRKEQLR